MFHLLVIILLVAAGNMYTSAKTNADSEKGIINSNGVHIRQGPGLNYSISQTASKGETFSILERKKWMGKGKTRRKYRLAGGGACEFSGKREAHRIRAQMPLSLRINYGSGKHLISNLLF